MLSDNNIDLYCVGLYDKYNTYQVDYSTLENIVDSDRLFRHIPMEDIDDLVKSIFESQAYANLTPDESEVLSVNIPAPESGRAIRSVNIELYSTDGFVYDAESSEPSASVSESAHAEYTAVVSDSDMEISDDGLEYTIRVFPDNSQNVYCRTSYTVADKYIAVANDGENSRRDVIIAAIKRNANVILWSAFVALLAAFVVPIVYRILRRRKYEASI